MAARSCPQCHNCLRLATYLSHSHTSYKVCYDFLQNEVHYNWQLLNERQFLLSLVLNSATMIQESVAMLSARQIELDAYARLEEAYLELKAQFDELGIGRD